MSSSERGLPARHVSFERERGVYQVLVTRDLAQVVVTVGADSDLADRILLVLRALADRGIPVFLVKLHRTAVSFAVDQARVPEVDDCLRGAVRDLQTRPDLALVSVIATNMRDLTGVLVNIADALQRAGAHLYGMGDSHNSVECLISGPHVEAALRELHREFGLERAGG